MSQDESRTRRLLFALFFAFVAMGLTFYLFLFAGLMTELFLHPLHLNPAMMTGLEHVLRTIALPMSVVAAVVVFVFTARPKPRARQPEREKTHAA
jgi:ABC-type glycerol-3-phosphate transport system permease component